MSQKKKIKNGENCQRNNTRKVYRPFRYEFPYWKSLQVPSTINEKMPIPVFIIVKFSDMTHYKSFHRQGTKVKYKRNNDWNI